MVNPDDLVERVAREICCPPHLGQCRPEECSVRHFLPTARAAIAVLRPALRAEALEEAARVADEYGQFDQKMIAEAEDEEERAAFQRGAFKSKNIAAAIRAMIPKEDK